MAIEAHNKVCPLMTKTAMREDGFTRTEWVYCQTDGCALWIEDEEICGLVNQTRLKFVG